jgi:F0F1-type ATP synthase membrane subunit c/vacuolar-type H+-ATPase subunit K
MSLGIDESKAKDVARERDVDANYRTLRIIWLAILASVIAIFVVTRVVESQANDNLKVLFWILMLMGLVNFGASFFLKHKLLKQATEKRKPELARSAYIIAFALCEAIGLFGFIAHLVTGIEYYYFFFVLSAFGILMHKPQRDDLLTAIAGGGIWETRKND